MFILGSVKLILTIFPGAVKSVFQASTEKSLQDTVYRVLHNAGDLHRKRVKTSVTNSTTVKQRKVVLELSEDETEEDIAYY